MVELLLSKGYEVHGIIRRSSSFNTGRIEHLYHDQHTAGARFTLHYGDLTDAANLLEILAKVRPDEVYNLAAQSHVNVSFRLPEYTAEVDAIGTLRLLDAIRAAGLTKKTKFYQVHQVCWCSWCLARSMISWLAALFQASTSELYGKVQEVPQCESTPFYPRSPYGTQRVVC